jgi:hypothetical protein
MRILLAALVALVPATALADVAREPGTMKTDDCARARKANKTCELTIEPERVNGKLVKNDLPPVVAVDWGKAGSLIRLRRDFIAEILKTAEDL